MIQFSWPELLLFLFSALVCGAVVYNFLSVGTSSEKIEAESTEEDFISAEEKQRLRNYDLDENLPKLSGKNNDLIKQLENRIEKLEEQLRFPVNQELQNRETKDESLYSDDYEKIRVLKIYMNPERMMIICRQEKRWSWLCLKQSVS